MPRRCDGIEGKAAVEYQQLSRRSKPHDAGLASLLQEMIDGGAPCSHELESQEAKQWLAKVGKIVQVIGAVVDVQFENDLPKTF